MQHKAVQHFKIPAICPNRPVGLQSPALPDEVVPTLHHLPKWARILVWGLRVTAYGIGDYDWLMEVAKSFPDQPSLGSDIIVFLQLFRYEMRYPLVVNPICAGQITRGERALIGPMETRMPERTLVSWMADSLGADPSPALITLARSLTAQFHPQSPSCASPS